VALLFHDRDFRDGGAVEIGRRKGRVGRVRTGRARVKRRVEGANMITRVLQKRVDRE